LASSSSVGYSSLIPVLRLLFDQPAGQLVRQWHLEKAQKMKSDFIAQITVISDKW